MMDYLTVEESLRGYKYLLIMMDHFTKLAVAVPTWDQTAKPAVAALWKKLILVYDCPAALDQEAALRARSGRNTVVPDVEDLHHPISPSRKWVL